MCDIEQMFNQCKVYAEHQDYLRYVWYDYNEDGTINFDNIADYKMTTHLFGACSSPSCANAALKKTAADNKEEFGEEA